MIDNSTERSDSTPAPKGELMLTPFRITSADSDWSASHDGYGTSSYVTIVDARDTVVALVVAHAKHYEDMPEANRQCDCHAALFAAAPELLAALRQYVACDAIKNDGLAKMARAAIAKATGATGQAVPAGE